MNSLLKLRVRNGISTTWSILKIASIFDLSVNFVQFSLWIRCDTLWDKKFLLMTVSWVLNEFKMIFIEIHFFTSLISFSYHLLDSTDFTFECVISKIWRSKLFARTHRASWLPRNSSSSRSEYRIIVIIFDSHRFFWTISHIHCLEHWACSWWLHC